MADEIINQPVVPVVEVQRPNPVEERITDLSSKVKTASDERDAANTRAEAAERKAAFAEGFVDVIATPELAAAKDHKADIEAKVMSGYSVKDATYAVLGAAGKLGSPKVERQPVAGGSASTNVTIQTDKSFDQMTQKEKRDALVEAQRKGDLGLS